MTQDLTPSKQQQIDVQQFWRALTIDGHKYQSPFHKQTIQFGKD